MKILVLILVIVGLPLFAQGTYTAITVVAYMTNDGHCGSPSFRIYGAAWGYPSAERAKAIAIQQCITNGGCAKEALKPSFTKAVRCSRGGHGAVVGIRNPNEPYAPGYFSIKYILDAPSQKVAIAEAREAMRKQIPRGADIALVLDSW